MNNLGTDIFVSVSIKFNWRHLCYASTLLGVIDFLNEQRAFSSQKNQERQIGIFSRMNAFIDIEKCQ